MCVIHNKNTLKYLFECVYFSIESIELLIHGLFSGVFLIICVAAAHTNMNICSRALEIVAEAPHLHPF